MQPLGDSAAQAACGSGDDRDATAEIVGVLAWRVARADMAVGLETREYGSLLGRRQMRVRRPVTPRQLLAAAGLCGRVIR
jgi:hypothetical protein